MKQLLLILLLVLPSVAEERAPLKLKPLSDEEKRVIIDKGTERPYSGGYDRHFEPGVYTCKRCGAPLYRSEDQFDSGCGWPAFDDEIPGAVRRIPDPDGYRTEIVCARCGAHLGHLFTGERLTEKNLRHCVNSVSMEFVPAATEKKAYFAGGCFWGVEYHFEKLEGVIDVVSGYMGGHVENPGYHDVTSKKTGHYETVEVTYDPARVSYETLAKLFFEIHDPTQADGQGPDIGPQYRSAIFTGDPAERETLEKLIRILESKGLKIATEIRPAAPFYEAEPYHQDYYERKGSRPYCHSYRKRF